MLQLKEQGRAPAIEVCPTTAFFLLGLQSYADHPHLRKLLALHYPFSINTDDSGIFSTNITTEISHVMLAFDLNLPDIVRITGQSIQHAFVSSAERAILRERFSSEIDQLAQQYPQYELNVDLLTTAAPSVQMDMSHLYTM